MSWQTPQLKYALGLGSVMSFYGVVSIIVWLIGDRFGYAMTYRVVTIALILITLPFVLLIGFVAARSSNKRQKAKEKEKEQGSAGASQAAVAPESAPKTASGNYGELNAGVEEVVQFLKSSNLGEGGIYSLPWYIVAGAPKAGKTSLVLNSSLNFQTLPSQRQSELRTIRPTPNVDWRVTSEAVFFDTAGRYQTDGVDGDEWNALVEAIKKARGNRPLDGMIIVVDTEHILKGSDQEVEQSAKMLRSRLDEVIQRTKLKFPVYLVFTHADTIEGFRDSFSTSKGEDKTLVWGATIPLDKSDNAQAMFDSEYEILHSAVMKRRLLRLSAPFPPVRQLRIFNFPLHFGSARKKLGSFMNTLFRPNPFSENPLLRGYYFTAAPSTKAPNGAVTAGSPYFTERLFKDVILRDKDLVSTFLANRQKAPIFGWFLTLLTLFVTFVLLLLSGISLFTNRQMLLDAKDRGESLLTIVKADAGKSPLTKNDADTRKEINATEDLRQVLAKLDDYERNGPPFYMRFGLYSGSSIYKNQLLPIYMNVIEQRYKVPVVAKMEADLRKFATSPGVINPSQLTPQEEENLGKNYDLLKAYLMLTTKYKANAEPTHLSNTLKDYWVSESKVPPELSLTALSQLEFWAQQVDRDDEDFPRIAPDDKLVAGVRDKLKAFPAWQSYYRQSVSKISKQMDDTIGKMDAAGILARNSGDNSLLDSTYTVPGAYTRAGYEQMKTAFTQANEKINQDDWVRGEEGKSALAQATDVTKIQDQYYRDYADNWRKFVQNVNVKSYKNKDDAANAIAAFSSANSPMKILLVEIAKNTNLSAPPENQGLWDWIKSFVASKTSSGNDTVTQPEKEFLPLFTFTGAGDKSGKAAPIDDYGTGLNKIAQKLSTESADKFKLDAQAMADGQDPLGIDKALGDIKSKTQSFTTTASGQEIQLLVIKPLGNLKVLMGADQKSQIAKQWSEQILPAAKDIEKGFPYDDGDADADLTKLTAFLNPNDGTFSKFYKEKLDKYFEESNGQLKVKDSADLKDFSPEFIAYINNVIALRKALFGTSPTPKFEYEFMFKPVNGAIIEVTIDGQTVDSGGTQSLKGAFPAPTGSQTGVVMKLGSTGGAPAAAPAGSANSAPAAAPKGGDGSLSFGGSWGLFRFVDKGHPQKQSTGEYSLSYTVAGKAVSATIKPSGGDLFDKSVFRNAKAPQNIFK